MTKIKFFKKQDKFIGFECKGHTGYSESGQDVLCATISGITQSCLVGLLRVVKVSPKCTRDDESGYLKIELPNNLNIDKVEESNILIAVVYESIMDLIDGYSEYISMEVIENVY